MTTILWAALMANGNYMHGDSGYRWKKQVFEDFDACMLEAGNCIIGRKTYEEYAGAGGSFGNTEIVVVSRTNREIPGISCVTSPTEAIKHLEEKGFKKVLVGGGDSILNAFLADGFGDELVINLTPELGGVGSHVCLPDATFKSMTLLDVRELGEGILRLHYSIP
ncbi:MAG: dihydrofolate reductase family protein [Armatimonadetes bacterium]|nr:dihydrofolate reductase family protein [Armatimonadota bacterium]